MFQLTPQLFTLSIPMDQTLPLSNWSLSKLLQTEPDSYNKARIKVLYMMLLFALLKLLIFLPYAWLSGSNFQIWRGCVMLGLHVFMLKLLLSNRSTMKLNAHISVWIGLFLIWSTVYISARTVNIVTLQFVYMIILGSFYLLSKRMAILYSVLSTFPVILFVLGGQDMLPATTQAGLIGASGYQIIVILNFITLALAHYMFHQAFNANVEEKEALNLQLQEAVAEANRASQSKSDFLSTMSHELRTPLSSMIGIAGLLIEDPHDKEQAENLKLLNFSAIRLHSVINDILDFNKLGSDRLQLEEISVDLYELTDTACSAMRVQAREKGLELVLEADDAMKGIRVLTDPSRITQILYNLIGNAIKFTHSGQVVARMELLDKVEELLQVRFSVADTGIGINPDQQKFIFEPFTQASTSITRNYGGTGLGLAIVKRLLLLFNSTIELSSEQGKGSAFSFSLSLKTDQNPRLQVEDTATATYDLSHLSILVVEDNPMNRLLLKKMLARWNNEPDFAENGRLAIDQLEQQLYDVILMDIHMPVMDGYQASRIIRQMPDPARAATCIVALTASVSDSLGQKVREAGMNDFISKPFNPKDLYSRLKDVGSRKQAG